MVRFTSNGSTLRVYNVRERKEPKSIQPLFWSDTDFEQKPEQGIKALVLSFYFPIYNSQTGLSSSVSTDEALQTSPAHCSTLISLLRNTLSILWRNALTDCRCSTSINHSPFLCFTPHSTWVQSMNKKWGRKRCVFHAGPSLSCFPRGR